MLYRWLKNYSSVDAVAYMEDNYFFYAVEITFRSFYSFPDLLAIYEFLL